MIEPINKKLDYTSRNSPQDVLKKTSVLLNEQENLAAAQMELKKFLINQDNPFVWRRYGDILLRQGHECAARAVYRNVILKAVDPHIKDIITARIPYCKPIVLDATKIVYFDIPKGAVAEVVGI